MSASRSDSKLHSLEGLRGVAAMMVLLLHLQYAFCIDLPDRTRVAIDRILGKSTFDVVLQWVLETLIAAIYDGGFAVWVFWVMSAVVLSQKFFELSHQRKYYSNTNGNSNTDDAHRYLLESTIRRYPRLVVPVVASTLIAYWIHKNGWMSNIRLADEFGDAYRPWLGSFYSFVPHAIDAAYCGTWQAFFQYEPSSSYNPLLWTIEKEMWGSLFLFSACALVGQFAHRWVFYVVAMFVIWKIDLLWLNAFVSGMAISDLVVLWNKRGRFTAFPEPFRVAFESRLVSLVIFILIWITVGLPNFGNVTNWIVASLLTLAVITLPPIERVLKWKPILLLGGISFGLYLLHFPIMCSFSCWLYKATAVFGGELALSLVLVSTIMVSTLGAMAFTILFDRPAIRFSKLIGRWLVKPKQSRSLPN